MKEQLLNFEGLKKVIDNIKKLITNHTHKYAGSDTEGGVANSSNKLAVAHKIGNASFDGTSDITLAQMGTMEIISVTRSEHNNLIANNQINDDVYYNITDEEDFANIIKDNSISSNTSYSSKKIDDSYSKKSILINTTLSTSNWSGDSAPYSYTLAIQNVTETNIVEINYSSSASEDAIAAYQGAGLRDGGQSNGKITILAVTKKPDIDIPIIAIISDAVVGG